MKHSNWLAGACAALLPVVAQAAAMMLVEGVTGPSRLAGYGGWFIAENANWNIDRAKVAEPHSFIVSMESSAGAAALIQLSATGAGVKRIVLDQVATYEATNNLVMLRLTCEEAFIRASSVSVPADDKALIQLKIQCGRLVWETFDYGSTKTPLAAGKGSWNFKTNTP